MTDPEARHAAGLELDEEDMEDGEFITFEASSAAKQSARAEHQNPGNPKERRSSGRGRAFKPEEKARIVAESYEAGKTLSEVAKRNQVSTSAVCMWRREFRAAGQSAALEQAAKTLRDGKPEDASDSIIEIETDIRMRLPVNVSQFRLILAAVQAAATSIKQ